VRLVDYVAPAYSTGAEQKWFDVGLTGSRAVAGRAGSRSAESARCVSGAVCAVIAAKLTLTVRRDSTYFLYQCCVRLYIKLNRVSSSVIFIIYIACKQLKTGLITGVAY
jgi:hypothetical protein